MAIKLFPIGYLNASLDSRGSWAVGGTATNYMFEPNKGCKANQMDTTLISEFENHSISTRQKIPIFKSIIYNYEDIWSREYEVIDRFYTVTNGRADTFYVVDFSEQERATNLTKTGDNITVNIADTHKFNTIAGRSGYWAIAWKPTTASLMIGKMVSISVNASITFTASYGDLKVYAGDVYVYPMMECFFADTLENFETGDFNPEGGTERGYLRSGTAKFTQYGCG